MKEFWNSKAQENAQYYISSYRAYSDTDKEEFFRWGEKLALEHLASWGHDFTGEETMLEIGCGNGRMTKGFAKKLAYVTAIDIAEEMIRQAREECSGTPNVDLQVCNGVDLSSFEAEEFHLVYSYHVFQHIPDKSIVKNYIQEAGRVLKTNGLLLFQVDNSAKNRLLKSKPWCWIWFPLHELKERIRAGGKVGPKDLVSPACRGSVLSLNEVREFVGAAPGLAIERIHGEGTPDLWVTCSKSCAQA